ncbi:MAG: hypothetical protein ACE5K4_05670 [Candidatus Hydrothermarchaeota archaeon]
MEERECRCIKCNNELFRGYREKIGLKWNIQGYKNDAIYIPNVGWLCLNHFTKEGLIHDIYVKYYSCRVYLLKDKVYVDEKLTFSARENLRVYKLKPSMPFNHFWGNYEEIRENKISEKSDAPTKKVWVP